MNIDAYNAFCAAQPHSQSVVQWGGAHVWKIGGKVYAIGSPRDEAWLNVTFKCSPMSFALLKEQPGLRPAPYLASRGMSWIQRISADSMDDAALLDYLRESRRLVMAGLTKAARRELGEG